MTTSKRHRAGRLLAITGPPFLVFAVVIGIWYAVNLTMLAPYQRFLLPLPHEVVKEGFLKSENLL